MLPLSIVPSSTTDLLVGTVRVIYALEYALLVAVRDACAPDAAAKNDNRANEPMTTPPARSASPSAVRSF